MASSKWALFRRQQAEAVELAEPEVSAGQAIADTLKKNLPSFLSHVMPPIKTGPPSFLFKD